MDENNGVIVVRVTSRGVGQQVMSVSRGVAGGWPVSVKVADSAGILTVLAEMG